MAKKDIEQAKATRNQFQFMGALEAMAQQKGLDKEEVIENIKEIFVRIYHKKIDPEAEVKVVVDIQNGRLEMYNIKNVVSEVKDEYSEVSASSPLVVKAGKKVGDKYDEPIDYSSFTDSIAAQIKQQLIQKNRETEKSKIYMQYKSTINEVVLATVSKVNENHVILDLNDTTAFLSEQEMIEGERYYVGQKIYVYVIEIKEMAKNSPVVVSRSHPHLVKKLVEMNVEDVKDGIVDIVAIQRIPGRKTKIAVSSNFDEVDAVGAFIGVKGSRINNVLNELENEKVEIILFSKDPVEYITNALSPARIHAVNYNDETKESLVIVPDDQFQIAVGKGGINVKLAVKLTKVKIDIKTLSWAIENNVKFAELKQTGKSGGRGNARGADAEWRSDKSNLLDFGNREHDILEQVDMKHLIENHQADDYFDANTMYQVEEENEIDSDELLGYLNDDGEFVEADDEDSLDDEAIALIDIE